jgi:hypothetical protein
MGIMPGGKDGLFLRVVRGMDGGTCFRVVVVEFGVATLVRAGRDVFTGIMTWLLVVMGGGCRFASW